MSKFFEIIDSEIRKAIPDNCKMISSDKLFGEVPYKIRCAFNSSIIDGKSKLIHVLALNSDFPLDEQIEDKIVNLRNQIISKDCILLVIYEQEDSEYSDLSAFVNESLRIDNPNFFSLSCFKDKGYKTSIDGDHLEELNKVIHDLWSGKLIFFGPKTGLQNVNLELMKDKCLNCNKNIKTVTGIVFPDQYLDKWDNENWLYFNQLVPLSALDSKHRQVIVNFVNKLRLNDNTITPVVDRFNETTKAKYLSAACPYCNSLRGDFHVSDFRMHYLDDFSSRVNKDLQYYSFELQVDNELIETLSAGNELSPHTFNIEWERVQVPVQG